MSSTITKNDIWYGVYNKRIFIKSHGNKWFENDVNVVNENNHLEIKNPYNYRFTVLIENALSYKYAN